MKNINNVNKKYYVIISVLAILGFISVFWLVSPLYADSGEDAAAAEYTTTEITTTTTSKPTTTIKSTTTTYTTTTTHKTSTTVTSLETTTTSVASTVEEVTTIESPSVVEEELVIDTVEFVEPEVPIRECVVYKPSTHYVHRSTCRWTDSTCYEITDTNGIECRRCSECSPDIVIVTEYVPEVVTTLTSVDNYDRQLLAEIVMHEAGSSWITTYNKAKVAAGVMNRVYDGRFPATVYGVLTQSGQFSGFWPGCITPSQDCYDAVDYYFSHTGEFNSDNSWWGDGSQNHFYYQ